MRIIAEIIGDGDDVANFTERLRKLLADFGTIAAEETVRSGGVAKVSADVTRRRSSNIEVTVINPKRDLDLNGAFYAAEQSIRTI